MTERHIFSVWYIMLMAGVIVHSQARCLCKKKKRSQLNYCNLRSHVAYKTALRHCKLKSWEFLYILGPQCGQCARAGVSIDERAVWYLCEFYIPAVLTVNKALVDGSISRAGSGLWRRRVGRCWRGGGGGGCYSREKPRGMIKVVNICRCRARLLCRINWPSAGVLENGEREEVGWGLV